MQLNEIKERNFKKLICCLFVMWVKLVRVTQSRHKDRINTKFVKDLMFLELTPDWIVSLLFHLTVLSLSFKA